MVGIGNAYYRRTDNDISNIGGMVMLLVRW